MALNVFVWVGRVLGNPFEEAHNLNVWKRNFKTLNFIKGD